MPLCVMPLPGRACAGLVMLLHAMLQPCAAHADAVACRTDGQPQWACSRASVGDTHRLRRHSSAWQRGHARRGSWGCLGGFPGHRGCSASSDSSGLAAAAGWGSWPGAGRPAERCCPGGPGPTCCPPCRVAGGVAASENPAGCVLHVWLTHGRAAVGQMPYVWQFIAASRQQARLHCAIAAECLACS